MRKLYIVCQFLRFVCFGMAIYDFTTHQYINGLCDVIACSVAGYASYLYEKED